MDIRPDELLRVIRLPRPSTQRTHYYRKVGTRRAQAISKVCFAATVSMNGNRVDDVRIALGSVAPIPIRCAQIENSIRNKVIDRDTSNSARAALAQNPQPAVAERPAPRPLNMLVLGDSITWGQGLKDEHKAWHQTKTWLKETTGRDVRERIEAHSGAMIGSAEARRISHAPLDGEVNRAVPTINEQIDEALKSYPDPSQVDLVLVDGCINDVDARRLLNAVNTPDEIHRSAEAKCGGLVESLLHRVTASFPNAHVIVTGYFPIISQATTNDFFMIALAKRLYSPAADSPPA